MTGKIIFIMIAVVFFQPLFFNRTQVEIKLKVPEVAESGAESILFLQIDRNWFTSGKIKVVTDFTGCDESHREIEISDDLLEIPFVPSPHTSLVYYHIRIYNGSQEKAFLGKIKVDESRTTGLRVLTSQNEYRSGGILRVLAFNKGKQGLIRNQNFHLKLTDPRGNDIDIHEEKVDDGMLLYEIPLAGVSGEWKISLKDNYSTNLKTFDVRQKSRKLYSVEIMPLKGFLKKGHSNRLKVSVKHLAGGSVKNLPVTLKIQDGVIEDNTTVSLNAKGEAEFYFTPEIADILKVTAAVKEASPEHFFLPLYDDLDLIRIKPSRGFFIAGVNNECSVDFIEGMPSGLKVFHNGEELNLKQKGSLAIFSTKEHGEISVQWDGGDTTVDTDSWVEKAVDFEVIEIKGKRCRGRFLLNDAIKNSQVTLVVTSGNNVLDQISVEANGNICEVEFECSGKGFDLGCQFFNSGGLILKKSFLVQRQNEKFSMSFKNEKTEPGKSEALKGKLALPSLGTAAVIVRDKSLGEGGFLNHSISDRNYKAEFKNNSEYISRLENRRDNMFSHGFLGLLITLPVSVMIALILNSNSRLMFFFFLLVLLMMLSAMILPALGSAREKAKGAAAGLPAPSSFGESVKIRKDFKDSIFFSKVNLDSEGKFSLALDIPDNLTTWKAEAVGFTEGGAFFQGESEIVSTKDFFIESNFPFAFVKGDLCRLNLTVYNKKGFKGKLKAVQNNSVDYGKLVFEITGVERQSLEIPAKFKAVGKTQLEFIAEAEGASDGLAILVNIQESGEKKVFTTNRSFGTEETELILPEFKNIISRKDRLFFYPGKLSLLFSGINSLVRKPTGCFEQTSSKNYPNIIVYRVLNQHKKNSPMIPALKRKLIEGYQRLLSYEVSGGGFSLYAAAPADPWLSAYGLLQFKELSQHVFVSEKVIARTGKYVKDTFMKLRGKDRLMALYSLQLCGESLPPKFHGLLKGNLASEDLWDKTLSCLLLYNESLIKKEAVESILQDVMSNKGVFMSNTSSGEAAFTEVCSFALILAARVNSVSVQSLEDRLFSQKRGAGWQSTMATCLALKALSETVTSGIINVSLKKDGVLKDYKMQGNSSTPLEIELSSGSSYAIKSGSKFLRTSIVSTLEFPPGLNEELFKDLKAELKAPREMAQGAGVLQLSVKSGSRGGRFPMIEIPFPAGAAPDEASLNESVKAKLISRFEYKNGSLFLYLPHMRPEAERKLQIKFMANFKGDFKSPAGRVYQYYLPEKFSYIRFPDITVK